MGEGWGEGSERLRFELEFGLRPGATAGGKVNKNGADLEIQEIFIYITNSY